MTDFSTPRRMSPGAFVIMFLKSFKDIVGAAFVVLVYMLYNSHDSGGRLFWKFALAAGIILTYSLAVAFTRYYFRKFHIEGDKLIYTRGLAEKQTTSIPLSRIHTLRTKRGLVYRLLSMRGVAFDTLASDKQEVELILDERDWQMLLERVSKGENFAHITDDSVALPPPVKDDTRSISNLNILKGALCQNHLKGFAVLATVTLALFDKISQIDDNATDRIIEYIGTHAGDVMPTAWQCLCLLVAIYLIVMALWTGKIALRYDNMTLRMTDNLLTIESGLVSRFTCRLAREKTTVLTIKRNPLEKIAGCQTISLQQAENATDSKNEGGIRIYGSNLGDELLAWWLGNNGSVNDTTLLSAASGIGLMMRRFIPHLLLAAGGA
ncbi:PH domain-containing protein, partial [uncultured Muribaculum sp.]